MLISNLWSALIKGAGSLTLRCNMGNPARPSSFLARGELLANARLNRGAHPTERADGLRCLAGRSTL
jgi:hypothetical protein